MRNAEWFADLYQRFGFSAGVHLRRIHYILVSQEESIRLPDGADYANTNSCWKKLCVASKDARYAGLVDIDEFVDRRNPEADIYLPPAVEEPSIYVDGSHVDTDDDIDDVVETMLPEVSLGSLPWVRRAVLPAEIESPPRMEISGQCPTPYHVELWCEKSTVNDVIMPLAARYGLNFQGAVGEVSITLCRDLAARVRANGDRPSRIFYISDFDVAGQSMPVAAARKLQWFLNESGEDLDVRLHPIVLTHEQCVEYRLPRTPFSDTDRRAARFEARYGEGRTELDALEALHPGELRKILMQEIERFHDPDASAAWEEMMASAQEGLDGIRQEIVAPYRGMAIDSAARLESLRGQIEEIEEEARMELESRLAGLREQVEEIQADVQTHLAARLEGAAQQIEEIQADVAAQNDDIRQELEAAKPDIEDMGLEPREADEWPDPLFDSTRDYEEQIACYKQYQGKLSS
jgi:hypothetical protein